MTNLLLNARRTITERLGEYPSAYFMMYRIAGGPRRLCVRKDTAIVIEGFPRSANTFALNAFRIAQNRPGHVAHHLHSAAQVIRGVRWKIPTLVLVRDPVPAVASLMIRHPHVTPDAGLRSYIRFYECMERYLDDVVIADFQEVIRDFGSVIGRVNRRFQTSFAQFEHTEENVRRCFERMNDWQRSHSAADQVNRRVTHPHTDRQPLARQRCDQMNDDDHLRPIVTQAKGLYQRLAEHVG